MSTRNNNRSNYENHQRAAELHDLAAHAHRGAAEAHEKGDHRTGQALSRQALEHSRHAHESTALMYRNAVDEHGIATSPHQDTAAVAHTLWQARGCPEGSPDEDWFRAVQELRTRAESHQK